MSRSYFSNFFDDTTGDWVTFGITGLAGYGAGSKFDHMNYKFSRKTDSNLPSNSKKTSFTTGSVISVIVGPLTSVPCIIVKKIIDRKQYGGQNWKMYMLSSLGGYCGGKLGSAIFSKSGAGIICSCLGGILGGGFGKWWYKEKDTDIRF
uniref:Uncharacterized protein n=1 Tax=Mimivirus LCMiAC02 TaxID=2506609 RepID=A0A481Z492_9VIRU|nr:MAG: hypothetical protein LCMiAC02_05450 [Mimivirus LCMiAC02]